MGSLEAWIVYNFVAQCRVLRDATLWETTASVKGQSPLKCLENTGGHAEAQARPLRGSWQTRIGGKTRSR